MSLYKDELDKIVFSYSTLKTYEDCPFAFYLKKIEGESGDTNAHAQIGKYGHEFFEHIFKGEITPDEALAECIEDFEDIVTEDISEASMQKKYAALCQYLADLDVDNFFKEYEVLGVEKKFNWEIDGHKMIGFADLILKRKSDGKIVLVDHKSAGRLMKKDGKTPLKNQIEYLESYKKQMYMYADAMKKTMGFFPDIIVWNHFLDGGIKTIIEFNQQEYEDAIQWVKDTIEKIYADEEFIENKSYVMCNMLCNYRNTCEYKNDGDEDE